MTSKRTMNNINQATKSLKIGHWNCNSISTKKLLFNKFLHDNYFDIFCLNETKCKPDEKLSFVNYNSIQKNRNNRGGGVAILIKNHIPFNQISNFDQLNLELIAIQIKTLNQSVNIICLYNPPLNDSFLTDNFFAELNLLRPFILIGDLNCHSTNWHCKKTT